MRSFAALFLIASIGACSPPPIRIDIPFDSGDRSAIIAVEQGGTFEVFAVGDSERLSMPVLKRLESFEPKDGMTITVLLYRMSLAEHSLRAGQLERAAEDEASRDVPNERRIVQGVLGESGETTWTQLSAIPEPLAGFKIEAEDLCSKFSGTVFPLGGERYFDGIVPVDENTVWALAADVGPTASRFYEVTRDGARLIASPPELGDLSVLAVERDRSGQIWLSGIIPSSFAPRIYAGTPATGWVPVLGRPTELQGRAIAWLRAGSPEEDPSTMYSLTQRGDLERYSQGQWTTLRRDTVLGSIGGISVGGEDDVYYILPGGHALHRYDGLSVTRETTDIDAQLDAMSDRLRAVAVIPGFGHFAGSELGHLLKKDGARWSTVAIAPFEMHEIRAMIPYRDEMLFTGRYGYVYEYDREVGLCPGEGHAANLGFGLFLDQIVPLRDGWAVGGATSGDEAIAGWFELNTN